MKIWQKTKIGGAIFVEEILSLLADPVFLFVTVMGNSCILLSGSLLYLLEGGGTVSELAWFDYIYWAFATVTTVGYGDVVATTVGGKVVSIFLMILGTGLFWSYAALFASALLKNSANAK